LKTAAWEAEKILVPKTLTARNVAKMARLVLATVVPSVYLRILAAAMPALENLNSTPGKLQWQE